MFMVFLLPIDAWERAGLTEAFLTYNGAMTRCQLIRSSVFAVAGVALTKLQAQGGRRMRINLSPGPIGLKYDQMQTIEAAARHGFEAVEPDANYLSARSASEINEIAAKLKSLGLVWGMSGLTVDFRKDEAIFDMGMAKLPQIAKNLSLAGVTRVNTYILPAHPTLPYLANMRQTGARLGSVAKVFADNGLRLGLEYVGPKTLWTSQRFPFLHTMAECKDLIAETKQPNVGFILDSWHWFTAGETVADLKTLTNQQIVGCDLNDAPLNIPVDLQVDSRRELPLATGVIPVAEFLKALAEIGYDGPVRAEPFNQTLRTLPPETILSVTAAAMKKAMQLV